MNELTEKPEVNQACRGVHRVPRDVRKMLNKHIGHTATWIQGGDGEPGSNGYLFRGKIVGVIMMGDSAHELIEYQFHRRAKRYTTDISDRWHRFLIALEDDDYATPIIEKVLIGARSVKIHL